MSVKSIKKLNILSKPNNLDVHFCMLTIFFKKTIYFTSFTIRAIHKLYHAKICFAEPPPLVTHFCSKAYSTVTLFIYCIFFPYQRDIIYFGSSTTKYL